MGYVLAKICTSTGIVLAVLRSAMLSLKLRWKQRSSLSSASRSASMLVTGPEKDTSTSSFLPVTLK